MTDNIIKTVWLQLFSALTPYVVMTHEIWFKFLLQYIGFSSNCFGIIGDTYILSSSKSILLEEIKQQ